MMLWNVQFCCAIKFATCGISDFLAAGQKHVTGTLQTLPHAINLWVESAHCRPQTCHRHIADFTTCYKSLGGKCTLKTTDQSVQRFFTSALIGQLKGDQTKPLSLQFKCLLLFGLPLLWKFQKWENSLSFVLEHKPITIAHHVFSPRQNKIKVTPF